MGTKNKTKASDFYKSKCMTEAEAEANLEFIFAYVDNAIAKNNDEDNK